MNLICFVLVVFSFMNCFWPTLMLANLSLICTWFWKKTFYSRICDYIANFGCYIPYIAIRGRSNVITSSPLLDENNFFYGQVMKKTWWTANNEWRIFVLMREYCMLIQAVVEGPFPMQSYEWKITDINIYKLKITWDRRATLEPNAFGVRLGFHQHRW